jgi:mRNA-degrading endonuclease YafQ of YafQ-DinJ toxin-antitoxin module
LNKYRIFETKKFQKDLKQIARSGHSKIAQKLRDFVYPQLRKHSILGKILRSSKILPRIRGGIASGRGGFSMKR